jgi:Xaa-Pro aminopeptidase
MTEAAARQDAFPTYRDRVKQVSDMLSERHIDLAIFVSDPNVRYLSGFHHFQSVRFLGWSTAFVVTAQGDSILFSPSLTLKYAEEHGRADKISPFNPSPAGLAGAVNDVIATLLGRQRTKVGYEVPILPTSHYLSLIDRLPDTSFVDVADLLAAIRMIKNEEEVEALRQAARIADLGIAAASEAIAPGVTELEVMTAASAAMMQAGAEGIGHCSVKSGPNSALIQPFSSPKQLRAGEVVNIDLGALYEGYCSDLTRTFVVDHPSARQRALFDLSLEAYASAVGTMKPGTPAQEVDRAARRVVTKAGYGDVLLHLTGHGIGLEVHEKPLLSEEVVTPLQAHMVLCIEPGVYALDAGGMRTEDMFLVTDSGVERLTTFPHDASWR